MGGLARALFAGAVAAGSACIAGTAGAQVALLAPQGQWSVTTTSLPGGSKAHSINEAGEIVGEGLAPDGRTIRPIWLDGMQICTLEGITGKPYSWDSSRHAVGFTS